MSGNSICQDGGALLPRCSTGWKTLQYFSSVVAILAMVQYATMQY